MTTTASDSKWKLGTIVSLDSHFYSSDNESKIVVITGEPKLISPLMVIVETVIEKTSFDESTGMKLSDKDHFQCKCIWFSHKSFQFEEAWISSRLLKIITSKETTTKHTDIKFGALVELKTAEIELGKKKSTLKQVNETISSTITSELSFVSPTMQVTGTSKSESKEPLFDPKTLKTKRYVSKSLVKCKFYNPNNDKITEVLIPIEALEIVNPPKDNILNEIKNAIRKKTYLLIEIEKTAAKTILSPKKINVRSGRYYVSAYDYLLCKTMEMSINSIVSTSEKDKVFSHELPDFSVVSGKPFVKNINKAEIENLFTTIGKEKIICITYEDINEVVEGKEKDSSGVEKDHSYLKAFCLLRNADRFFRIDRIKEMKVLDF